jgi:hypothetical protein
MSARKTVCFYHISLLVKTFSLQAGKCSCHARETSPVRPGSAQRDCTELWSPAFRESNLRVVNIRACHVSRRNDTPRRGFHIPRAVYSRKVAHSQTVKCARRNRRSNPRSVARVATFSRYPAHGYGLRPRNLIDIWLSH